MAITVTCPSCSSSFPVDPAKIPEGGVNARCSSCGDVFRIEKPVEAEPLPTLEEVEPSEPAPPPQAETPSVAPPEEEIAPAPDEEPTPAPGPAAPGGGESPTAAEDAPEDPFAQAAPFEQAAPRGEAPAPPPPSPEQPLPAPEPDEPLPPPEPDEPLPSPEPDEPLPSPEPDEPLPAPEANDAVAAPSPQPPAPDPGQPDPAEAVAETSAPAVQGFTFGKRDPKDKAKRLARVLVSDMIMYNAERHQTALAQGTLQQDFEEEIEKSWKEFVEQVGEELADSDGRQYWKDALNDILAKGEQVF